MSDATADYEEDLEVLVVGAGQAALATGFFLQRSGVNFRLFDRAVRVGDSWRRRYDSLVLFSPRDYSGLPGLAMDGNPDGYASKNEIADYLERYARANDLPTTMGEGVAGLSQRHDGFIAMTGPRPPRLRAGGRRGRRSVPARHRPVVRPPLVGGRGAACGRRLPQPRPGAGRTRAGRRRRCDRPPNRTRARLVPRRVALERGVRRHHAAAGAGPRHHGVVRHAGVPARRQGHGEGALTAAARLPRSPCPRSCRGATRSASSVRSTGCRFPWKPSRLTGRPQGRPTSCNV